MAATLAPETPADGAPAADEDAGQAEVAFRFVKRCVDEQTTHAATQVATKLPLYSSTAWGLLNFWVYLFTLRETTKNIKILYLLF